MFYKLYRNRSKVSEILLCPEIPYDCETRLSTASLLRFATCRSQLSFIATVYDFRRLPKEISLKIIKVPHHYVVKMYRYHKVFSSSNMKKFCTIEVMSKSNNGYQSKALLWRHYMKSWCCCVMPRLAITAVQPRKQAQLRARVPCAPQSRATGLLCVLNNQAEVSLPLCENLFKQNLTYIMLYEFKYICQSYIQ